MKVNKICAKFEDMSELHQQQSTSCRNLKLLQNMALKIVSSGNVPKPVIVVSIARIKYTLDYPTSLQSLQHQVKYLLIIEMKPFNVFHFLNIQKKNQIEPHTFDPTHKMMNLRAHACKSSFQFFNNESFICVSDVNNNDKIYFRSAECRNCKMHIFK